MARYRLGVDVGGTNTDLVLHDEVSAEQLIEKLPSTPSNPAEAVLQGIERLVTRGVSPKDIVFFAHGTTVTTNALLELKGVKIGLFITEGYTGVIDVQTQTRAGNMFDYTFQRPEALVSREFICEIRGRVDHRGAEIVPLDLERVRASAEDMARKGIRSFAICYLFSFMNRRHEQATADVIRAVVPDATISMSSSVMPRIREWPRFSTTMLNAYLEPILVRYIDNLARGLDKLGVEREQRFLMQSNGGVMPFSGVTAGGNTVHTLLSGPAAGVQGACHLLAGMQTFRNLITMDIGGTSCDIAFIEGGTALEISECSIDGRQIDVPSLDIVTIAAGGGAIARVDRGGFLIVGPDSAGAVPGPACFGRGGSVPTITDAYVECGLVSAENFLGGTQMIDPAAAHRAIETHLAKPLQISCIDAAVGVMRVVNARIADEIRLQAAKKGVDLSTFTLVAFGGAGPVHAAAVAEELGIGTVLVPFSPGAFSALGLLCSDIIHDFLRSDPSDMNQLTPEAVASHFTTLEAEALAALAAEKLSPQDCEFIREFDMHYAGQGYELRVGLGDAEGALDLDALRERFHRLHELHHGHSARDRTVDIVSYRLRARIRTRKVALQAKAHAPGAGCAAGMRDIRFGSAAAVATPIMSRADLMRAGSRAGPAIIVQFDTTTVIPPGWIARADAAGNVIVERNAS